jgi:hypothetical protein
MRAVAETLAEMELPGTMALAAIEKLLWCANLELAERFGGEIPTSSNDILDIIENRA